VPLRILHISTRLILGGSQENTVLSCEGQARLGHDVHLAFGPIYGPEGSLLDRVRAFRTPAGTGITTHEVPHLVREVRPLADLRAQRELRALIARLKPDVVHTHSSKAGILGRRAAWSIARGSPPPAIIHTIHGPPFMPADGGPLRRAQVRLMNFIYTLAERSAARRAHRIVSVADAMTREFLRRGIGRPNQFVTVRSGMEIEPFLAAAPGQTRVEVRARLGLSESDIVVGTVARLAQHKGHDDLLDALAPDLRANPRLKLLWVGDGWWRDRLTAKALGLGLRVAHRGPAPRGPGSTPPADPAQVILTGLVTPDLIPGLIRAMDVLAHPSYREGLPRTVPQALLAGVCPVAYDVDGTGEVCVDGVTGRLVPPGDLHALREAVAWCANNPALRQALAAHGRERCARDFDAHAMVAALDALYTRAATLPA
jgi:glycosyltransferase involved in cell wall biosynthesis